MRGHWVSLPRILTAHSKKETFQQIFANFHYYRLQRAFHSPKIQFFCTTKQSEKFSEYLNTFPFDNPHVHATVMYLRHRKTQCFAAPTIDLFITIVLCPEFECRMNGQEQINVLWLIFVRVKFT